MIVGVGTDLVRVSRVARALDRRGDKFAEKLLDEKEFAEYLEAHQRPTFLAKRFAAKEAAAKATGIGLMREFGLQDLAVGHDDLGKPVLRYTDKASKVLERLGIVRIHLSISDDGEYAQAFAIAENDA